MSYSSNTDKVALNERLNNELTVVVNWFRENGLMGNSKKVLALVLGAYKREFCFVANEIIIDEYDNIYLLRINVDNQTHLKCLARFCILST